MHGRAGAAFVVALAAGLAAALVAVGGGTAGPAVSFTNVPDANTKSPGFSRPNLLSPELQEIVWAQGSNPVENPSDGVVAYGYDAGAPFLPVAGGAPGSITLPGNAQPPGQIEARKTEPDKNTYLVLKGLKGADANYDYGTHFLFQGHEGGSPGYITRINLDADGPHRVTLLATKDTDDHALPTFDGSTWDPWTRHLLFTSEAGPNAQVVSQGGAWQATLDVPSTVENLQRVLGRGGFEGIQNDDSGNLYYVEDVGGSNIGATKARRPNSFVYRFLPKDSSDLTQGGDIQALQVLIDDQPITFADGGTDVNPAKYLTLHTYNNPLKTKWITLTTTTSATAAPGPDDNALAKQLGATPLKRPENGLFRPGSHFKEFFFDETGDTNLTTPAAATGGFGSILRLTQDPKSDNGSISLFFLGDAAHSSFDNTAWFSDNQVAFVEDGGDTLHTQNTFLDSGWMFDATKDYSGSAKPVRFLAQGRDASATIDSALSALYTTPSFYNDGDNEITGIHVADGDPTKNGILGAKVPKPFRGDGQWRAFYTQQHGDNNTYELIPSDTRGD
jgi:hypothetical protein